MTARALRRKAGPLGEGARPRDRVAFHLPANDNNPVISRRIVGWVLMVLGFVAAVLAVSP